MIKGIIFDSDGTIFHSDGLGKETLNIICKKFNLKLNQDEYNQTRGLPRKEKLKILFPNDWKKMWPEWDSLYWNKYSQKVKAYHGAIATIKNLHEKKIALFIFSTKNSALIKMALKKYKITNCFVKIIGGEKRPIKPAPKIMKSILKRYGLLAKEVILVGDTIIDEESAINLKVPFVFLNYPSEKNIRPKTYKTTIKNLTELQAFLKKQNTKIDFNRLK
ncbi:MAG: HAD-IA family hydrolase [archaeon]|mgnify:CR=1 FL=1